MYAPLLEFGVVSSVIFGSGEYPLSMSHQQGVRRETCDLRADTRGRCVLVRRGEGHLRGGEELLGVGAPGLRVWG